MTEPEENPFLAWRGLPDYARATPERLTSAVDALLPELEAELARIESTPGGGWEAVVTPIARLDARLGHLWGLAGHLLGVRNTDALRQAYERAQPRLVAFSMRSGQSRPIYDKLCALGDGVALDEAQRRILEALIESADRAGVGLDGAERERFNAITTELAGLSTAFSNNVLDATAAWELLLTEAEQVRGLPPSYLAMAAQSARSAGHDGASAEEGPWRITLDGPSVIGFLKDAADRGLRERVYYARIARASDGERDNAPNIERILALRREKASMLGYANYAEMSLAVKMAPSADAVAALSEQLHAKSFARAKQEHAALATWARERGDLEGDLRPWDVGYWAERVREARYDLNDEEVRPYFPMPKVLDGLFALIEKLFGARIEPADGEAEVWHEDVRYFRVFEGDRAIASFFLDPYARPGQKRGGAWQASCVSRGREHAPEGEVRDPVAYVICNGTPPVDGRPSLMTFQEALTLFHEFGHALQDMLTRVEYVMAAGTNNVEWDAIELSSQFMENWLYVPQILDSVTGHYESGAPLPAEVARKIIEAKNFMSASFLVRQLTFGLLDMKLHRDFEPGAPGADPLAVQFEVMRERAVLEPLPEDRFLCSFAHIFAGGYAAGYYSYLWADVLNADAFEAFVEAGLDDEDALIDVGRRFRDTVLAVGGARRPMDVFIDFRGREPDLGALLRARDIAA